MRRTMSCKIHKVLEARGGGWKDHRAVHEDMKFLCYSSKSLFPTAEHTQNWGQWGFSIRASDLNISRGSWGMGWVLLESLCDCLQQVGTVLSWLCGFGPAGRKGSVSLCLPPRLWKSCFPGPVVADFWKYDVTPNVILKIDMSLLLSCFVQFVSCHLKGYNE